MIRQTFDLDRIGYVVRHPSIYPRIADDRCPPAEEYDPSWTIQDGNIALEVVHEGGTGGVFVFQRHSDRTYEVHVHLLPECRDEAVELSFQAARWIFTHTPCVRLTAIIPDAEENVWKLAEASGLRPEWLQGTVMVRDGESLPGWVYVAELHDWLRHHHERIVDPVAAMDLYRTGDSLAARYCGAAVWMVRAGGVDQGIALLNDWAGPRRLGRARALYRTPESQTLIEIKGRGLFTIDEEINQMRGAHG